MAASIKFTLTGTEQAERTLRAMDPRQRPSATRKALTKMGLLVQRNAATQQIKRGGKGAPLPDKLTSRTGTGRRSIRVNRKGLRGKGPSFFVDVGSDLVYMALHETGGTVSVPQHGRQNKSGTTSSVRAHSATYPKRAWLAPAFKAERQQFPGILTKSIMQQVNRA